MACIICFMFCNATCNFAELGFKKAIAAVIAADTLHLSLTEVTCCAELNSACKQTRPAFTQLPTWILSMDQSVADLFAGSLQLSPHADMLLLLMLKFVLAILSY